MLADLLLCNSKTILLFESAIIKPFIDLISDMTLPKFIVSIRENFTKKEVCLQEKSRCLSPGLLRSVRQKNLDQSTCNLKADRALGFDILTRHLNLTAKHIVALQLLGDFFPGMEEGRVGFAAEG